MCALAILLFMFTIANWERVALVLQILAIGLSSLYCFFGGMGIFKFSRWLGERYDKSPTKVAASLWSVFFIVPMITQVALPSDIIDSNSLGLIAVVADRVVTAARTAVFVYGFGHVILLFLGWFIIGMARDPSSKESVYSWSMVMYVLILGMLTFFLTLQMAATEWFPQWIPSVNGTSILQVVWLPISITGVVAEGLVPKRLETISSAVGLMSSTQRILMVIGFFLAIQPGYLLFPFPTPPLLFLFNPSVEILGIMFFVGLALMAYPILDFMGEIGAQE